MRKKLTEEQYTKKYERSILRYKFKSKHWPETWRDRRYERSKKGRGAKPHTAEGEW